MDSITTDLPDVDPATAGDASGFSNSSSVSGGILERARQENKEKELERRGSLFFTSDQFSDQWAANNVAHWIQEDVRYLPGVGEFYVWDGSAWRPDDRNQAPRHVSKALVQQAEDAKHQGNTDPKEDRGKEAYKFARRAQGLTLRNRVLKLVKEHPAIVEHLNDFDTESLLLNTPAGPVDLTTGEVSEPDPYLLLSQRTAVEPQDREPTRWLQFLEETTLGRADLSAFLQRWVGYCATGLNVEKYIFGGFGGTDSGKSVFGGALGDVMGSYHATIPQGTLLAKGGSRHPTDLASFVRARLATSSEVPAGGSKWRSDVVKAISGGDPLKVRRMREDFYKVEPTSRLMLFSNHLPATGDDGAMRRRILIVPFDNKVPLEEQDKQLQDKLVEEEGGQILSWIIEGAEKYLRDGLGPLPTCVQEATEEYRESEDRLTRFLQDACDLDPEYSATTERLYGAWQMWCEKSGYPRSEVGTQKTFTRMLKQEQDAHGLNYTSNVKDPDTGNRRRGFGGVQVKTRDVFEAHDPAEKAVQESKRQRGEA